MEELEAILNELEPLTIVELGIDDPADAWAGRLAPDAQRVVTFGAGDGSGADLVGIAALIAELDEPLDLVIDHWRDDTERMRAAIDALLPLVRTEGLYVIGGATPSGFTVELMFSTITSTEVVHQVVIGRSWAVIRRGVEDLEPGQFHLADADPFHLTGMNRTTEC